MAVILFIIDIEEGHLLPSLALADVLRQRGHAIHYISLLDNEEMIQQHGFDFHPIFEQFYPRGFRQQYKKMKISKDIVELENEKFHLQEFFNGKINGYIEKIKPDLFIISYFLPVEALLLHYKFGIRPLLLNSEFRDFNGQDIVSACRKAFLHFTGDRALQLLEYLAAACITINSIEELIKPLGEFYELVPCPRNLGMEHEIAKENMIFCASCIRKTNAQTGKMKGLIPEGKKIIYASLGSQAASYGKESWQFYRKLINAMKSDQLHDLHLVLSTGGDTEWADVDWDMPNVSVLKWVSQIDLLKRTEIAITHGGLGTVRECIYFGVPMIVIPMSIDQPLNAKRIEHHRLGVQLDIHTITEQQLIRQIVRLQQDAQIRANIKAMQQTFRQKESEAADISFIERQLLISKTMQPG